MVSGRKKKKENLVLVTLSNISCSCAIGEWQLI